MKKTILLVFTGILLFVLSACGGSSGGTGSSAPVILGIVKDATGTPIANITVTAVGTTATPATTDANGNFQITGVTATNRQVVSFEGAVVGVGLPVYVPTWEIVRIQADQGAFLSVVMTTAGSQGSTNINSSVGGTWTNTAGAVITLTANSLVDEDGNAYTGIAYITVDSYDTSFDPATQDTTFANLLGLNSFPGEFIGEETSGTVSPLQSYGYADIQVVKSTDQAPLQLASGQTAALSIPIPTSLQAGAPATIKLWHFNETTGVWDEIGTGTINGAGTDYTGNITSFSVWNFDVAYPAAYLTGTVTDCITGDPIEGARVSVVGNGWKSGETGTSSAGVFPNTDRYYVVSWDGIPVNTNSTYKIWAEKNGMKSAVLSCTSGAASTVADISACGALCISSITGTYTGAYIGADDGHFSMTVGQNGLITGNGNSEITGDEFTLTGQVGEDGIITAGSASLNNATFSGLITVVSGAASVVGTWTSDVGSGTFSGPRE